MSFSWRALHLDSAGHENPLFFKLSLAQSIGDEGHLQLISIQSQSKSALKRAVLIQKQL